MSGTGRKRADLTGQRFGRLVVLSYDHSDHNYIAHWRCLCDCGNEVVVAIHHLTSGETVSCGCYQREASMTHGMSTSRLYNTWCNMKGRCNNPNDKGYDRYGGRGIFVCDEWMTFENFRDWSLVNGYAEDLTIDRIDNNDGYYPENCRWVDRITQCNNRGSNRCVEWHGETHTLKQWAGLFGVRYPTLWARVQRGDMRDFEEYFGGN